MLEVNHPLHDDDETDESQGRLKPENDTAGLDQATRLEKIIHSRDDSRMLRESKGDKPIGGFAKERGILAPVLEGGGLGQGPSIDRVEDVSEKMTTLLKKSGFENSKIKPDMLRVATTTPFFLPD